MRHTAFISHCELEKCSQNTSLAQVALLTNLLASGKQLFHKLLITILVTDILWLVTSMMYTPLLQFCIGPCSNFYIM